MSHEEAILLAIISCGAFVIPLISNRLLLPSAVGEIIFGLILGLFFQESTQGIPTIKFLSEFGFIILMYLAGMEIDFQSIARTEGRKRFVYISLFVVIILSSFYVRSALHQPLLYALVYLTSSIGLLVPVLKDTGLLKQDAGQKFLVIGSIGEIISLAAITLFSLYFRSGISANSFISLFEIICFFIICYLILKIFRLYIWWNPLQIGAFIKTGDPFESGIRANFVNLFVFVSLATILGVESIVGAFLGGVLFALIFPGREEIIEKMNSFGYGFLVPLFFIEVGLRFDIRDFFNGDVTYHAVLIAGIIFVIRSIGSLVFIFSKFPLKQSILIPCSLSFPLTLLIAIATLGLEIHVIGNTDAMVIILAAIVTALIYPWAFRLLVKTVLTKTY
jgi:Kef-type K+ transport system membrane component KefB